MSAEAQRFIQDPLKYITNTCINLQTPSGINAATNQGTFHPSNAYSPAYFDFVPWASTLFGSTKQVDL